MVAELSFWKSIVLLGEPSFFGTTTILAHHLVGVVEGTGSMMPSATSLARSSFTAFSQCNGIGIGVWIAWGMASWRSVTVMRSPVMAGRGWCGQTLKALAAKKDLMKCSSFSMFPGTGRNGMVFGSGGGGKRLRHPHGAFGELTSDVTDVVLAGGAAGKLLGRTPRSISAFSDNKQPQVFLAKYMICFVKRPLAVILTGKTPRISSRVFVTPRIPWELGRRCSVLQPSRASSCRSPEQV